jgi:hypothetical protein
MWDVIEGFADLNVAGQLLIGATFAGMLVAFLALATRES